MAQLCLYLDDKTMGRLREDSSAANRSLSGHVSDLINGRGEPKGWPAGYWGIYGALTDDSFVLPT